MSEMLCDEKKSIYKGWFMELLNTVPGEAFSLKLASDGAILGETKSPYQHVLTLKTETFGNMLVLDGVINCTERDEFAYQEMLAHLALCSHPDPQKVLIIGGGDGGVAREVCKYDKVLSVDQCELDASVVELSKAHLPFMACGFEDPRVTLHIGDGVEFMKKHSKAFDIIITDSSDPEGPAEELFKQEYYKLLHSAVKDDGLIISQGESLWIAPDELGDMMKMAAEIFPVVSYAHTQMPSYSGGHIGFLIACKKKGVNLKEPLKILSEEEKEKMKLRYYNENIHRSSFVFPRFIQKIIDKNCTK